MIGKALILTYYYYCPLFRNLVSVLLII